mgnify:FL=1
MMKKITRRSVLRLSGLAAASLALTSCRAAGSAAVGRAWEILPVVRQSIGILSCFLSLCIGIVCAADVFRRHRCGIQVRDSGKGRRRFGYAEPTENGCF